jgi:hypothetical protein
VDEHDRVAAPRDRETRGAAVDLDGFGLQRLTHPYRMIGRAAERAA